MKSASPVPRRSHEALLSGELSSNEDSRVSAGDLIAIIAALILTGLATWNAYRVLDKWGMIPNFQATQTLADGRPMLERTKVQDDRSFHERMGFRELSDEELVRAILEVGIAMSALALCHLLGSRAVAS